MKRYSFEKLNCWIKAKELSVWIYKITMDFPAEQKFGLVSQMRRAAISIASNMAEGTARKTHYTSHNKSKFPKLINFFKYLN